MELKNLGYYRRVWLGFEGKKLGFCGFYGVGKGVCGSYVDGGEFMIWKFDEEGCGDWVKKVGEWDD